VAIVSYGFWQRHFGGVANIIGTPLIVDGVSFAIAGVTPPEFFGAEVGRAFDVAIPFGSEPLMRGKESMLDHRRAYWLTVMLRLKPGQSIEQASTALRAVTPQIREGALPPEGSRSGQGFLDEPFTLLQRLSGAGSQANLRGPPTPPRPGPLNAATPWAGLAAAAAGGTAPLRFRYTQPLLALLVVVAVVLCIACANIANLLLARAAARRARGEPARRARRVARTAGAAAAG
jgi:hypothetical protein